MDAAEDDLIFMASTKLVMIAVNVDEGTGAFDTRSMAKSRLFADYRSALEMFRYGWAVPTCARRKRRLYQFRTKYRHTSV